MARRCFLVSFGAIVHNTLIIATLTSFAGCSTAPPQPDRWQYLIVGIEDADWTTESDSLGGLGWELIQARRASRDETKLEAMGRSLQFMGLLSTALDNYRGARSIEDLSWSERTLCFQRALAAGDSIHADFRITSADEIRELEEPRSVMLYECIFKRRLVSDSGTAGKGG